MKLTKAQKAFLRMHPTDGTLLDRFPAHKTYDFVGRMCDAGLIEIEDGKRMGWPYTREGTRITDAGRTALEASNDQ